MKSRIIIRIFAFVVLLTIHEIHDDLRARAYDVRRFFYGEAFAGLYVSYS